MDEMNTNPAGSPMPPQPMGQTPKQKGYGKRPMWQWIVIYLVAGGIVYGAIYYFAIAKKSDDGATTNTSQGLY